MSLCPSSLICVAELPVEQFGTFARSPRCRRSAQIGWLFGAGTSASAGVPTATQLLTQFKAVLYASATGLDLADVTMADPLVAARVNVFFDDANGLPPTGVAGGVRGRIRAGLRRPRGPWAVSETTRLRWAVPWFGHRALAAHGIGSCALGCYDQLRRSDRAGLRRAQGYQAGLASDDRTPPPGSCRSSRAARFVEEVRRFSWSSCTETSPRSDSRTLPPSCSSKMRPCVRRCSTHHVEYGLAVFGYSGRDESVMETLRAAVEAGAAFPHGLALVVGQSASCPSRRERPAQICVRAWSRSPLRRGVELRRGARRTGSTL